MSSAQALGTMLTGFSQDGVTIRVDGEVLEVVPPGPTHRTPLKKLQVRLLRRGEKAPYTLWIGESTVVGKDNRPLPLGPLYSEVEQDAWVIKGTKILIKRDAEPSYREFFAGLAPLCGGREVKEPRVESNKRGLFGRHGN